MVTSLTRRGDVDEFVVAQTLIFDPFRRSFKGKWRAQRRRNGAWGLRAVLEGGFQPGHQKIRTPVGLTLINPKP